MRFIISRNSFVVNAASRGPRLAIIETCLTVERERSSSTGTGTSYLDNNEGGVRRIRAMSRATFPFPIIVT